eukprot:scaffold224666_cov18-Tisochrysis_lutea.AAC.3
MAYAMSLLGMQDDGIWEHVAGEITARIAAGQGSQFSDQALTNMSWAILKAAYKMCDAWGDKELALCCVFENAASKLHSFRGCSQAEGNALRLWEGSACPLIWQHGSHPAPHYMNLFRAWL